MNGLAALALLTLASFAAVAQSRYTISREPASGAGSPLVTILRDAVAGVEAAVAPSEGGELSSYRVKFRSQWIELLYGARDYSSRPGFKGKAPLLWPAVGAQYPVGAIPEASCGEGTYPVAGENYPMPCHGFARSLPWTEEGAQADARGARVTVELRDSPATRRFYPFAFSVRASYELVAGHLTINYTVASERSNSQPMPFSIGNHIAFTVPFVAGTKPEEMTFETPSTIQFLRNKRGVLSGEQTPRSFDHPMRLGDFDAATALPLGGYRSQPYARLVDPQGLALRISQQASSHVPEPLVRFNVFGGPKQGYISPEPWFGIQNSLNTRQGVVQLGPGESWKWRIELQADGPPPELSAKYPGIERVAGGIGFAEGPVWTKQGFLIFSDIYTSRIMKTTASNGTEVYRNYTHATNGNAMDAQGRLYSAERDGRRVVRQDADGQLTVVAAEWNGKRLNSPNDVAVRRDGHVYFTDPASNAVLEPQDLGFNGLFHVAPSGKMSLISAKLARPNGVALTPDGRTLYVADSETKRIVAFTLDAQGEASGQRTLVAAVDGTPDGLRVAGNGKLYVACRGICVYSPAGKLERLIEFPETPANCAFGDAELKTLFVTARTSVYRLRVPDQGPPN